MYWKEVNEVYQNMRMKKLIFFSSLLFAPYFSFCQRPSIQWQECYGGSNDDLIRNIIPTFDGGYIGIGETYSFDGDATGNHGGKDAWIIKLDSLGNLLWHKC